VGVQAGRSQGSPKGVSQTSGASRRSTAPVSGVRPASGSGAAWHSSDAFAPRERGGAPKCHSGARRRREPGIQKSATPASGFRVRRLRAVPEWRKCG